MYVVAITAVTRKIVIADSSAVDPLMFIAFALLIAALSWGYFLTKSHRESKAQSD